MNRRGLRTFGRSLAVLVALTSLGFGHAFQQKSEHVSALAQREFFKPDLHISTTNVKLEDMAPALAHSPGWTRFFSTYGSEFQVYFDPRSATPSSIMGHIPIIPGDGVDNHLSLRDMGHTLARPVEALDAAVVADAVHQFIVGNQDVLALDVRQLGPVRADKINADLWQISIPQRVNGVPVRYGRLAATISHGNLVLMGTETWGNATVDTTPTITAEHAMAIGFNFADGLKPADRLWKKVTLEVLPYAPSETEVGEGFVGAPGTGYRHRLAWSFGFVREGDDSAWDVTVDAHNGELLEFKDANQYITKRITGGIYPVTDTGLCPDNARCGTMQPGAPMSFANTGFAVPNNFANSAGLYNYPGGTLTTTLAGTFVTITDTCGAVSESSATGDLDLGGVNNQHDCTTAGASAGDTAATRSAFYEVNKLKEQARGWLPLNTWLQAAIQTNVNIASTCNAFYSPGAGTINFYRSGGGCRNTGEIAAVFDHEWGHGLDDNDTTGTLSNSSESYADIAAILRLQQSCVGYGFWATADQGCGMTSDGTGFNGDNAQVGQLCELDCSGVRGVDYATHAGGLPDTPTNFSCPKCSSGSGPCGREVHCDAMPASEAAWDFAKRDLQAAPFSYDNTTAFMIANKVYFQGSGNIGNWVTCTCPSTSNGCGAANAYPQWLAADDDNGNLADGTPHMTALFAAFNRHDHACPTPTPTDSGCAGAPTAAPTVTAAPGSNQVTLNWGAVAGATGYWVLRSEGFAGCDFGKVRLTPTPVAGTSYTDNSVANGTPYYYNVVAVGSTEACFGPASACVTAIPLPCAGAVSVNRSKYNCNDLIVINLVDSDLINAGSQTVTIRSTTETAPETVTLTESPASTGQFSGFFQTIPGPTAPNGDGYLSVSDGDTITVKYADVSFCGPPADVEQTATADCVGPVISNVHSTNVTGNSAKVLWDTNEASDSSVTYDTSTPPGASSASSPALVLAHSVMLNGLAACTDYYYSVTSTDSAANAASDTAGGAYYTFRTGVNVQPTYTYAGPPVPIPDNAPAGASASIVVPDNKPIVDLDFKVGSLTHTFDGDLVLHVIGPDLTDVILSNRRGSSGDNFINTVFDDAATTPIASGAAPFTGSFKPDNPLVAFIGKVAMGTWTFKVVDQAGVDVGTIDNWSLMFTYQTQQCGPSLEETAHATTDSCAGGGSNAVIDPGEDVVMQVTAHNNGTSGTTGISGKLSSSTSGVTVTRNTATFANLAADASAVSDAPHFAFTVDSSVPCGATLNFTIVYTANEGTWNDFFSVMVGSPTAATVTYVSTDVPKHISDPPAPAAVSTVAVADTSVVTDVNVKGVNITHTFDGDIQVGLRGPNGVLVLLSNRRGSSGDNFVNTNFDDAAATPIASGVAPFTGTFKPDAPLSVLNGITANGTWQLEVLDLAGVDTGDLTAWSLELTTLSAPACSSCTLSPPGEATDLLFVGSKTNMQWSAAPNATFYQVYRGIAGDLPRLLNASVDSCKRMSTTNLATGNTINDLPAPDEILWYLVLGANGLGEGPAGMATAGPRDQDSSGNCP